MKTTNIVGPQTRAAEITHAMKYRQEGETFRDAVNRVASVLKDSDAHVLIEASCWVDSAVSKTCNLDDNTPWEDFKNVYLKAWEGGAKGCTTFNKDGKRSALLTPVNSDDSNCQLDPDTGRRDCA
jgi:ribonucleotide reductase alpha subunit